MQGLSCFGAILSALPYTCLVLLAFLFFSFLCFACFLGVSRFLVGIILILVKCFSFFAFRILYRIIPVSHHISGKHLLLYPSVLISESYSAVRVTVNIEVNPRTPIE